MSAIELLAQIGYEAPELFKNKLDRLFLILIEALDVACRLDLRIVCVWCDCHWRHIEGWSSTLNSCCAMKLRKSADG